MWRWPLLPVVCSVKHLTAATRPSSIAQCWQLGLQAEVDLTKQQLEGHPLWLQLAGKAGKGDDGDDWGELEVAMWLGPKDHVLGRISEDHASEPDGLPLLSVRCNGKRSTLSLRAPVMSHAGARGVSGAANKP